MKHLKMIIFISIYIIMIFSSTSYAKYIFEFEENAVNIDIDNTPPNIEVLSIKNTNENKIHDIRIEIKIEDKNEILSKFETLYVTDGIEEVKCNKEIVLKEQHPNSIIYEILLNNITENVNLKIVIPKQSFKDIYNNESEEIEFEIYNIN